MLVRSYVNVVCTEIWLIKPLVLVVSVSTLLAILVQLWTFLYGCSTVRDTYLCDRVIKAF